MAIVNDAGQQVFYACADLIANVRKDVAHVRRTKKVSVACRVKAGVKIVFDYALDKDEEKRIQLADDEWMEAMTLGQLLAYAIRQNRLTVSPGSFDSVSELFDASGMTMSSFSSYFEVPRALCRIGYIAQDLVHSMLLISWLTNWNTKTKSNSKDLAGVFELPQIVQTVQK